MCRITVLLICLLSLQKTFAQKEYHQWYFGNRAGISFHSSPPSALSNGRMFTYESSSGICDSAGNLLYYTNGDTVYNRNHQVMLNGVIGGVNMRNSCRQGSVAVPVPLSNHLYYIFNSISFESLSGARQDTFFTYSIVDMQGDGGLGEVTVKNQHLLPYSMESIGIGQHANGYDYWLAAPSYSSRLLNLQHTVNGAFTAPITTHNLNQGDTVILHQYYPPRFSPDSRILVLSMEKTHYSPVFGPYNMPYTTLFKFDNATGQLSQPIFLFGEHISLEFSADSRFLYRSSGTGGGLEQFDLEVWDSAVIRNSMVKVDASAFSIVMQLGPDGKIYLFNNNPNSLSVIRQPEKKGLACDFRTNAINLAPRQNEMGGPLYPNFWFRKKRLLGKDTVICQGDSIQLRAQNTGPTAIYLWNTGDTSSSIWVKQTKTYTVQVTENSKVSIDSQHVRVSPKPVVYLGPDTAFCELFNHILNAQNQGGSYTWNTGDTTMKITVNKAGIYSVEVIDTFSCFNADTIKLEQILPPKISIRYDSNCTVAILEITNPQTGLKYAWNTGDTGLVIRVSKAGNYSVSASHPFCSNSNSIDVSENPAPDAWLGNDTNLCADFLELDAPEPGTYLWSTGETTPSIRVTKPGSYRLRLIRNGCMDEDTILVNQCQDMSWYIPNAFTPNRDGLNPVFSVVGEHIEHIDMRIYSRWGELLFEGNGQQVSWDGSYKDAACQEGSYIYLISIEGWKNGRFRRENVGGSVTLLR